MRKTYRVLASLLVLEVIVQAMAIAYALSGLGYWINEDGGVLNKAAMDSDDLEFAGIGGFMVHGINGMMLIPLLVILLLIVSFFARVPSGTKRAGILVGLVVLQVVLGLSSHSLPLLAPLHALNAFAIAVVAFQAARSAGGASVAAPEREPATV